ncbi:MAG: hypothetical protein AAFN93_13815, partial [Bacteroidota bacterium]
AINIGSLNNSRWTWAQFNYENPDKNINWIYSRTFTEGNKIGEQLTIANGLQQVNQQQSTVDDHVIVTKTMQDYVGRDALTTLPIPMVNEENKLGYKSDLLMVDDDGIIRPFDESDFDSDVDEATELDLPYYSGSPLVENETGEVINEGVASAQGFPYRRTVLLGDGTGRVREISEVGAVHSIGEKSVRTYYSGASESELLMLFGEEAPEAANVHKITVVDANGTPSVSYQNKDGKVFASALAIGASSATLLPLDSQEPKAIYEEIAGGVDLNEFTVTTRKPLLFTSDRLVKVNYSITPSVIEDVCQSTCTTCNYEVQIVLHRKDPQIGEAKVEVLESKTISATTACSGTKSDIIINHEFTAWAEREYTLEKRVITSKEQYTAGKAEAYQQRLDLIFNEIQQELDDGRIEELYMLLEDEYGCERADGLCTINLSCDQLGQLYNYSQVCTDDDAPAECLDVSFTIPMPDVCEEEAVSGSGTCTLGGLTFSEYFASVYNATDDPALSDVLFFNKLTDHSKVYFTDAQFDLMMFNLIADSDGLVDCAELWQIWSDQVSSFGFLSTLGASDFDGASTGTAENGDLIEYDYEYSLLENLLTQVEALIADKYPEDDPFEPDDITDPNFSINVCPEANGVIYYLKKDILYGRIGSTTIEPDLNHAYALAFYDETITTITEFLDKELKIKNLRLAQFQGTQDLEDSEGRIGRRITDCERYKIGQVGNYLNNQEEGIDKEIQKEKYRLAVMANCEKACELKSEAFKQDIINSIFTNDATTRIQHYAVSKVEYFNTELGIDVERFIGYKDVDVNSTVYDIEECELESMVIALIENCKGGCFIDFQDARTLGSTAQINSYRKIFNHKFEVQVSNSPSCGADYTQIDVDNILAGLDSPLGFTLGDTQDDLITDGAVHGNHLYVTGSFNGTINFDPLFNNVAPVGTIIQSIFVAKYDFDGRLIWVQTYGDFLRPTYGSRIALSSSGQLFLTYAVDNSGSCSIVFENEDQPLSPNDDELTPGPTPTSMDDGHVLRLNNTNGNIVWENSYTVQGDCPIAIPKGIEASEETRVVVVGNFTGILTENNDLSNVITANGQDIFMISHNWVDGTVESMSKLSGQGSNSVTGFDRDNRGRLLMSGTFNAISLIPCSDGNSFSHMRSAVELY